MLSENHYSTYIMRISYFKIKLKLYFNSIVIFGKLKNKVLLIEWLLMNIRDKIDQLNLIETDNL